MVWDVGFPHSGFFEKRYGQPYKWFIEREHPNVPGEVIGEPEPYFHIHRAVCRGT